MLLPHHPTLFIYCSMRLFCCIVSIAFVNQQVNTYLRKVVEKSSILRGSILLIHLVFKVCMMKIYDKSVHYTSTAFS